ncbi:OmpH family outer membrane protein [Glaciimonas sp. PCH181]|uniref:OmpH family outer membrane protein n=1 Tax=Glaciimonas sp. PCH181 TaxID=2133943 RepID=UPI000D3B55CF|nr:OmpH family outer membrane protein [Glaciimonas sp. PCH181]PUA19382.1 outer membrane protein chaperone [Glaciimonas sp. PCH181]
MKSLTKSFASLKSVAILALCLAAVAPVHAQEGSKIAFVSNERIFREAAPAKAADAKIQAEFSKRDKDLQDLAARLKGMADKLDKDSAVIPESERLKRQRELADLDKDFQRKQREFREDLNQRRNEELAVVLERTNKVIKQIADAENYDIVFQDAVYANKRIDITDKVLKALNK